MVLCDLRASVVNTRSSDNNNVRNWTHVAANQTDHIPNFRKHSVVNFVYDVNRCAGLRVYGVETLFR
jgi:hypothetical protein